MDHSKLPPAFVEVQFNTINAFNICFAHHVMKINENLHSFITIMEEPSNDIEHSAAQREKRIRAEFSRRFTRECLYPIQLKINELENEYLAFISKENCKIAQSIILRSLVLTVLKKLSSSTQAYLQFLRKNNAKVFIKLKEILNLISHSFEIIKSIVDHRILKNNEIEKLCEAISNCVSDQKQKTQLRSHTAKLIPNNSLSEGNVVKTSIRKTISHRKMKKSKPQPEQSKIEESQNSEFVQYCDIHRQQPNNTSYTSIRHSSHLQKGIKCCEYNDVARINYNNHILLRNSISETSSRISELILNELLIEVLVDVNKCIQKLALDAFDCEFNNNW